MSGRAAGHLWRLLRGRAPGPEVTAGTSRRIEGIKVRRARRAVQATTWRGIPVTTVARTLVDLANREAGGRRVDCRRPEHRLAVELDGYRYHHSRHAWEEDRRREREARARGDEFRRYTYGDVMEGPALMVAELHTVLSRGRSAPATPSRA